MTVLAHADVLHRGPGWSAVLVAALVVAVVVLVERRARR
jgi:hypothetical protein